MAEQTERRALKPVEAILDWYERAIRFAGGALMALIVVIMVTQVVARYGFNASLIWAEELCRYLLIWMTFLLLGLVYQTGGFVALDVVPIMLPVRARRILKLATSIPVLWFVALMTWYGWDYASRFDNQTIPAADFISTFLFNQPAGLSIRLVYVSVSVGSGLLALHVVVDVYRTLVALLRNEPDEERAPVGTGEL